MGGLVDQVSHVLEAGDERMAGAPFVEILNMHHLKAGLVHLMLRIEVRVRRQSCRRNVTNNRRMSKSSALWVREDIDLNLSHTTGELLSQRRMMVVQASQSFGILHLHVLPFTRRKSGVIAVVRANYLDLIQVNDFVLRRLRIMLRCHTTWPIRALWRPLQSASHFEGT